MIKYNTELPPLYLREYGRHMQKLVDHCVSIEDRDERTKCAYAIADIMGRLFPDLSNEEEENRTVWDHINIMSDFRLDIDFPCEVLKENEMRPKPTKISYCNKTDTYRCYGDNMVRMVKEVARMEGGAEKDNIIFLLANQMKKMLLNVNADSATDRRVFKDIREMTKGAIDIDAENYKLNDYIGITPNEGKKKKKK